MRVYANRRQGDRVRVFRYIRANDHVVCRLVLASGRSQRAAVVLPRCELVNWTQRED